MRKSRALWCIMMHGRVHSTAFRRHICPGVASPVAQARHSLTPEFVFSCSRHSAARSVALFVAACRTGFRISASTAPSSTSSVLAPSLTRPVPVITWPERSIYDTRHHCRHVADWCASWALRSVCERFAELTPAAVSQPSTSLAPPCSASSPPARSPRSSSRSDPSHCHPLTPPRAAALPRSAAASQALSILRRFL